MMRALALAAVVAWAAVPFTGLAAEAPPPTLQLAPDPDLSDPGRTSRQCLALARRQPDKAIELAGKWIGLGGGESAKYCQALSLVGLKEYGEGARRLEDLARTSKQDMAARAGMLAQAGQAWMLQGEPGRAYAAQSTALRTAPQGTKQHFEILLDRAGTLAEAGKYSEALVDVNAALVIDPRSADALAFRASAYRYQGEIDKALDDAQRALSLDPKNLAALLERGNLHRLKKRLADARQDWLRILDLDPDSPAADSARLNIEHLDVDAGAR